MLRSTYVRLVVFVQLGPLLLFRALLAGIAQSLNSLHQTANVCLHIIVRRVHLPGFIVQPGHIVQLPICLPLVGTVPLEITVAHIHRK
jgi:hypothetical protein